MYKRQERNSPHCFLLLLILFPFEDTRCLYRTESELSLIHILIPVKLLQYSNAESSMFVTLSGIVMSVKLLQPENAEFPMLVTLPEIVMLVKPVQFRNACLPILVTLSGIVMSVKLLRCV